MASPELNKPSRRRSISWQQLSAWHSSDRSRESIHLRVDWRHKEAKDHIPVGNK